MTRHHPRGLGGKTRGSFSSCGSRRGLTLLEVLLAMAILLMSLAGIGQLVDFGSDRALEAKYQFTATRLAQSKLHEVEAGVIGLTAQASGSFDDQGEDPGWSWTVTPTPEGPANLYRVVVQVSHELKGRQFEVSLTQMIVDPQMLGTAAQAEKPAETTTDAGSSSGSSGATGTTGATTP